MTEPKISRRSVIKAATAGALVPSLVATADAQVPIMGKKRVLRIAHLTDIHVQPERQAALGMEACLEHLQSHRTKPNMIVMGGDLVMDSLDADRSRVLDQWEIYKRVLKANNGLPVEACIGNHDVWGWGNRQKYSSESGFGKRMAMDQLDLSRPYRSFDKAGWHFILLDSTHPGRGNGYTAKLDPEQFEWLKDDLERVPASRPIIVFSHIPILSVCAYFHGMNEKMGNWAVPGAWMHIDARAIKDLFRRYANIKLCVSGHIHLTDRIKYNGISYYCNGAVSAGWWGGPFQECHNGYGLIDLYEDGFYDNRYVSFDWRPRP